MRGSHRAADIDVGREHARADERHRRGYVISSANRGSGPGQSSGKRKRAAGVVGGWTIRGRPFLIDVDVRHWQPTPLVTRERQTSSATNVGAVLAIVHGSTPAPTNAADT